MNELLGDYLPQPTRLEERPAIIMGRLVPDVPKPKREDVIHLAEFRKQVIKVGIGAGRGIDLSIFDDSTLPESLPPEILGKTICII